MVKKSNRHPADLIGEIDAEMAKLKKLRESLRSEIIDMGKGAHAGADYVATVTVSDRGKFDQEAAKEKLGTRWVNAHTSYKKVTTVTILPLAEGEAQ